jgi:alanine racemase
MASTVSVNLNLDNLRHNYRLAKTMASGAQVYAVLKSDAYGHGLMNVALGLADADGFALLQLEDALHLRAAGLSQPVMMMAGVNDARELAEAYANDLTLVVRSRRQLEIMLHACVPRRPVGVWVKVKSSINRFGFLPAEVDDVLRELAGLSDIEVHGLMMHFPSADDLDCELDGQWESFRALAARTRMPFSAANSAAMLRDRKTHGRLVRAGSVLYGNNPFVGGEPFDALSGFRPVMRFEASVIDTVQLDAGQPIGYGGTFIADRRMRIGVVGCGYGDGYPPSACTGTPVMIRGARTRILGRVAMNAIFIDLESVPDAQVGDWVTLWGDERLRIDEVAQCAGMSPEAIECGLANKHRVHLSGSGRLPSAGLMAVCQGA